MLRRSPPGHSSGPSTPSPTPASRGPINHSSETLLVSHDADPYDSNRSPPGPSRHTATGETRVKMRSQIAALALVGLMLHLLGRQNRAAAIAGQRTFDYFDSAAPLRYVAKDLHRMFTTLQNHILLGNGGRSRESDKALSLSPHKCRQEGRLAVGVSTRTGEVGNLKLLLDALKHTEIAVLVHLDKRAPVEEHQHLRTMTDQLRWQHPGFSSIQVMMPSSTVSAGGISEVDVNLRFIEAFTREVCGWRYFVNLSAEDFPLVRPQQLLALLSSAPPGSNFIDVNHESAFGTVLSRATHVVLDESIYRRNSPLRTNHTSPFRRRYPDLFTPFHGNAWHILSREFCEYAVSSTDGFPRRLFAYYANVPSPAEGYFQTLLCASEFADTLVNDLFFWSSSRSDFKSVVTERQLQDLRSTGALFIRPIQNANVAESLQQGLDKAVADADLHRGPPGRLPPPTEASQFRLASALGKPRGCASVARHPMESRIRALNAQIPLRK